MKDWSLSNEGKSLELKNKKRVKLRQNRRGTPSLWHSEHEMKPGQHIRGEVQKIHVHEESITLLCPDSGEQTSRET